MLAANLAFVRAPPVHLGRRINAHPPRRRRPSIPGEFTLLSLECGKSSGSARQRSDSNLVDHPTIPKGTAACQAENNQACLPAHCHLAAVTAAKRLQRSPQNRRTQVRRLSPTMPAEQNISSLPAEPALSEPEKPSAPRTLPTRLTCPCQPPVTQRTCRPPTTPAPPSPVPSESTLPIHKFGVCAQRHPAPPTRPAAKLLHPGHHAGSRRPARPMAESPVGLRPNKGPLTSPPGIKHWISQP